MIAPSNLNGLNRVNKLSSTQQGSLSGRRPRGNGFGLNNSCGTLDSS